MAEVLHTVLVVEDEPMIRQVVAEVLRDSGYEVVEAANGAAAIEALDQQRPPPQQLCLVLLDMMLPEVDGLGVLRHLTAAGAYVPVVAMSANKLNLAAALAAGAHSAVAKPFDIEALLATVTRGCRHNTR